MTSWTPPSTFPWLTIINHRTTIDIDHELAIYGNPQVGSEGPRDCRILLIPSTWHAGPVCSRTCCSLPPGWCNDPWPTRRASSTMRVPGGQSTIPWQLKILKSLENGGVNGNISYRVVDFLFPCWIMRYYERVPSHLTLTLDSSQSAGYPPPQKTDSLHDLADTKIQSRSCLAFLLAINTKKWGWARISQSNKCRPQN